MIPGAVVTYWLAMFGLSDNNNNKTIVVRVLVVVTTTVVIPLGYDIAFRIKASIDDLFTAQVLRTCYRALQNGMFRRTKKGSTVVPGTSTLQKTEVLLHTLLFMQQTRV